MEDYHRETAYERGQMGGHRLDWANQPHPFKRYRHREPAPLPPPRACRAGFFASALAAAPSIPAAPAAPAVPAAADLADLLGLAAGVTAVGPVDLRAPASAGALYPSELYALACGVAGLADGLYHFAPAGPGLHCLWPGRLAGAAARLLGGPPRALGFFVAATFWRSVWKYRDRAYRYCLLDAGHLMANLELALAARRLAPRTCLDFADASLGVFLGLAREEEVPLAAVAAGPSPADPGPEDPGLPPLDLAALPLSAREGRDPVVLAAHAAGNLAAPPSARGWVPSPPAGDALSLGEPVLPARDPALAAVIHARRSRRDFRSAALAPGAVSLLLKAALPAPGPCQATVLLAPGPGLPGGVYRYFPGRHALAPRVAEDLRPALAAACLDQLWAARAALAVVLHAELDALAAGLGPRGYRHALLAAGRAGQRLYLAATALGLGCCGIGAFYDRELARAARLPAGASPLYLLVAGPVGREVG